MKRYDFLDEIRSYIGTRYLHLGRTKATQENRGGVDCVGPSVKSCEKLGYEITDISNYATSPDSMMFVKAINKYMDKIELSEALPGDCLIMAFDSEPQHLAVISKIEPEIYIIHAYSLARKVVEHRLDDVWKSRLNKDGCGAYRFKGIID